MSFGAEESIVAYTVDEARRKLQLCGAPSRDDATIADPTPTADGSDYSLGVAHAEAVAARSYSLSSAGAGEQPAEVCT